MSTVVVLSLTPNVSMYEVVTLRLSWSAVEPSIVIVPSVLRK